MQKKHLAWLTVGVMMLGLFILTTAPSYADTVSFRFMGHVTSILDNPGNFPAGTIGLGDNLIGYFTYDTSASDTFPDNPDRGMYYFTTSPAKMEFMLDGFLLRQIYTKMVFIVGTGQNDVDQAYSISANGTCTPLFGIFPDLLRFSLLNVPSRISIDDGLPTNLNLSDWSAAIWRTRAEGTLIVGIVDSLESVTPVPEPSTMLLLGFGLTGVVYARRKFRK